MSKSKQIRTSLGFTKVADADLVSRGTAIHTGMSGNPAYPQSAG